MYPTFLVGNPSSYSIVGHGDLHAQAWCARADPTINILPSKSEVTTFDSSRTSAQVTLLLSPSHAALLYDRHSHSGLPHITERESVVGPLVCFPRERVLCGVLMKKQHEGTENVPPS